MVIDVVPIIVSAALFAGGFYCGSKFKTVRGMYAAAVACFK